MLQEKSKIDFVISWVDGNDTNWYAQKMSYETERSGDKREERFRDWDTLRYWFRSVEKNAPWVNKIHFVTYGNVPTWLNTNHPKLNIVNHKDFIPFKYLPTFNSHTIELNFHRIPGLAEHFVYFNDDIFLLKKVKPTDFFVNDLPCDMLAFQPIVVKPENTMMACIFLNNTILLSKYFEKRANVLKQPFKYFKIGYPPLYFFYNMLELFFPLFSGFYTVHGASALCKATYEELWVKEESILDQTCSHRFRHREDVNQYLMREWQKLTGNFYPQNVARDFRYFEISNQNIELIQTIEKQKSKTICMNDTNAEVEFNRVKLEIKKAFHRILPQKSSFEID